MIMTRDSKWSKPSSGIKIVPIITSKQTFTPGDAMRDIYTHGIITSDFVLVMGDLVSNVKIDEVVRIHKERRKTNKDAIMTMVVKESGASHRTRCASDPPLPRAACDRHSEAIFSRACAFAHFFDFPLFRLTCLIPF